VIVVIPRLTSALTKPGIFPLGKAAWEKTTLEMPKDSPKRFRNCFYCARYRKLSREAASGKRVFTLSHRSLYWQ